MAIPGGSVSVSGASRKSASRSRRSTATQIRGGDEGGAVWSGGWPLEGIGAAYTADIGWSMSARYRFGMSSEADRTEAAAILRRVVEQIDRGDVDAAGWYRGRLVGVVAGLRCRLRGGGALGRSPEPKEPPRAATRSGTLADIAGSEEGNCV